MTLPQARASVAKLKPYVAGKARAGSGKAIKLSSNESNFGPSPKAIEALKHAMNQLHRYPDGAHTGLREAISEVQGLPFEQLICGNGSDELINLLIHAYCDAGDNIVMSEHGFLMYSIYASSYGVEVREAADDGLTASVDTLLAQVNEKTRIVFLANPNNPTGTYLPASEVKRLHDGLPPQVILAIDAAYAEYPENVDYTDGRELVAANHNVIMLRTFSKAYALPSLRLGWGYASDTIIDILNRVRSPFNVNSLALAAGEAAMRDQEHLREVVALNNQFLAAISPEFEKIGITAHPSVGNFILLEFPENSGKGASEANQFLLERGIILREMAAYKLPNCLRFSIGLDIENQVLLSTLTEFMQQ